MSALRLFIAVELPEHVKALLAGLKMDIPGAAWVKPAAMHLTLKFLGDGIDAERVPPLIEALGVVHRAPFTLAVAGVGRFPPGDRKPARVLWVGLAAPIALSELAAAIDQAAGDLGFPPETRPFSPHLTLARLKHDGGAAQIARFLAQHADLRSPPFHAAHFNLISSQLSPQGSIYTRLARIPLQGD